MADYSDYPDREQIFAGRYYHFVQSATEYSFPYATLTGVRKIPFGFNPEHGGFGLLEMHPADRWNTYSPHGRSAFIVLRHSCNVWFSNQTLNATPDSWVVEVFNIGSLARIEQLRLKLIDDGFPPISIVSRNQPPRREKLISDYFAALKG